MMIKSVSVEENNKTDYRENLLTTPNPWAQLAALSHLTVALPAPPS